MVCFLLKKKIKIICGISNIFKFRDRFSEGERYYQIITITNNDIYVPGPTGDRTVVTSPLCTACHTLRAPSCPLDLTGLSGERGDRQTFRVGSKSSWGLFRAFRKL